PSLLILLTSQPASLPATVRSRCQKLRLAMPSAEQAMQWLHSQNETLPSEAVLQFSAGAPLLALEYAQGRFAALNDQMRSSLQALFSGQADLSQTAGAWQKDDLPERLLWLDLWLTSLARAVLTGDHAQASFPGGDSLLPGEPDTLNATAIYAV